MRSMRDLIPCSGESRPSVISFNTRTRYVQPFTHKRPSNFVPTFFKLLLDQILFNRLCPPFRCSHQLEAPRDKLTAAFPHTLNWFKPKGPLPFPRKPHGYKQTRSLTNRHLRSPRHLRLITSSPQLHNRGSKSSPSTPTGHHSILTLYIWPQELREIDLDLVDHDLVPDSFQQLPTWSRGFSMFQHIDIRFLLYFLFFIWETFWYSYMYIRHHCTQYPIDLLLWSLVGH